MKITHIITGLPAHGAEIMLYQLLRSWNHSDDEHDVISLTDRGVLADRIEGLGVSVRVLNMRPGIPNPLAIKRLAELLSDSVPDLVQCWMYHANLIGGLAARYIGNIPVVWGLHHTRVDVRETKLLTVFTARLCAWLSERIPTAIVCCSAATYVSHAALGYDQARMITIPNGIDLNRFSSNAAARLSFRKALGIPESAFVIGMAARFHPHKDHSTFIAAAGLFHQKVPDVHFLLCGQEVDSHNSDLVSKLKNSGLQGHCHLLGAREDMPAFYSALDLAVNSSISEAFPLAVAEAMASGVPCVVTDVGDCSNIVGDTGRVVRPRDSTVMAEAWLEFFELGIEFRQKLGASARQRAVQQFGLDAATRRYHQLYRDVLQGLVRPVYARSKTQKQIESVEPNQPSVN